MHKLLKYILIFIILPFFLNSCSIPNLGNVSDDLLEVKKGLNSKKVIELLEKDKFSKIIEINDKLITQLDIKGVDKGTFSAIFVMKVVLYKKYILYTFKNDKLYYWGTFIEYANSRNNYLNEIGEITSEMLDDYLY